MGNRPHLWPDVKLDAVRYGPLGGQHFNTLLRIGQTGGCDPTGKPYDFQEHHEFLKWRRYRNRYVILDEKTTEEEAGGRAGAARTGWAGPSRDPPGRFGWAKLPGRTEAAGPVPWSVPLSVPFPPPGDLDCRCQEHEEQNSAQNEFISLDQQPRRLQLSAA